MTGHKIVNILLCFHVDVISIICFLLMLRGRTENYQSACAKVSRNAICDPFVTNARIHGVICSKEHTVQRSIQDYTIHIRYHILTFR